MPIRTVYVSELPDPSNYLRGEELVLTNGLWRRSDRGDRAYVERLIRSGVSALGFGLTRPGQRVPETIVAACRERDLPLLEIPEPLAFSEVSDAVSSLAMSEMQRSVDQTETFLRHAARGGALRAILHTLASDRGVDAWCMAGPFVISSTRRGPSATDARLAWSVARNPHRSLPLTFTREDETTATVLAVRPSARPATVLAYGAPFHSLGAEERTAIDQAISVLALELDRREEHHRLKRAYTRELVELVADGEHSQALAARLELLGLPESGLRVLCMRLVDAAEEEIDELSSLLLRLVELTLSSAELKGAATGVGREVLVLVRESGGDALRDLAAQIDRVTGAELGAATIGIGIGCLVHGGGDLRSSLVQARYAARRPARNGAAHLTEWRDITSHRALVEMHDPDVLRSFAHAVLGPLLTADRRRNSCLVDTLRCFYAARERPAEAAAALGIHVNTLRQRLDRIAALTGRSLQEPASRVDLFVALNIHDTHSLAPADPAPRRGVGGSGDATDSSDT